MVVEQGFTFLLHETLAANEPNYSPGYIVSAGAKRELVTPNDNLALWQGVEINAECNRGFLSPIHVHIAQITKRWKNAHALSSYFIETLGKERVEALLEQFYLEDPAVAHAFVTSDGKKKPLKGLQEEMSVEGDVGNIVNLLKRCFVQVDACIRQGIKPGPTVLPDTAALIVLSCVAEIISPANRYHREGQNSVELYHLAGVNMVDYLVSNTKVSTSYLTRIDRLYKAAREVVPTLPENITLYLVPTSHLAELITAQGGNKLAELFSLAQEYRHINEQMQAERKGLLDAFQQRLRLVHEYRAFCDCVRSASEEFPSIVPAVHDNQWKFNELAFTRDQERPKRKLLGIIAASIRSDEMDRLQAELHELSLKMRTLRDAGVLSQQYLTQYDIPEPRIDKLVPDCVAELSCTALAELKTIISRA